VSLGGSVGIATSCGLSGPSNRDEKDVFRTRPDHPWGPPSLLYNGYRISCQGVKRPECGLDRPSFNAEVKQSVDLYLYPPSGPSCPVLGWSLPLPHNLRANTLQSVEAVLYLRRDLYLITHNTHNRQTSMLPSRIRTRNPSKRVTEDPRLGRRDHWERPVNNT